MGVWRKRSEVNFSPMQLGVELCRVDPNWSSVWCRHAIGARCIRILAIVRIIAHVK